MTQSQAQAGMQAIRKKKKPTTKLLAGLFLAAFSFIVSWKKTIANLLSVILSPFLTSLNLPVGFLCFLPFSPCFFYHTPSICPPLFSPPSPPALIMPHFAPLPHSPFLCPLSVSLAGIQGAKVEEEIDSKKDSHVMWRGTKEDPGGLGRLSKTPFIPCFSILGHTLHTLTKNNTRTSLIFTWRLSCSYLYFFLLFWGFFCTSKKISLYNPPIIPSHWSIRLSSSRRFPAPCILTFSQAGVKPRVI